jgi:hypothetical protein
MAPSSSTVLFGSALLVAAAAASKIYSSSKPSTEAEIADIDEEDDYITAEEVVKLFDRLFMEMQAVLAQLSQTVQQIQMSGQQIPEQQLRMMLKAEFERALGVKQKQVLDEYDMDDDCLEEATWEFLQTPDKYPKVKVSVERFQRLWENVSGESVVGKRPGGKGEETKDDFELLSAEKTIEAAEIYFNSLTAAMVVLVDGFKAQGKDLKQTANAQDLHMQFAGVANEKGEQALQTVGVTLAQFQKSIEANASDPNVGRSLGMMQMKQKKALMSMGVPTS